jgi:hypothetical protein
MTTFSTLYFAMNIKINFENKINVKKFGDFYILNYNKNTLKSQEDYDNDFSEKVSYRQLRSIVYRCLDRPDTHYKNYKIYSFSPQKSLKINDFIKKYPIINKDIIIEEFVEGTMINLFWNDDKWEISTKTNIGGKSTFFSKKTFEDMFYDACSQSNFYVDLLDKTTSYSFVLQHPDNRIVSLFNDIKLWLIEAYEISVNGINTIIRTLDTRSIVKHDPAFTHANIYVPKIYNEFSIYANAWSHFTEKSLSYNVMGCVIRNKTTNERSKIRNPNYEKIRRLRGNQPKLQYHYFVLLKDNKIQEFLKYYPEYYSEFKIFRQEKDNYLRKLLNEYKSCYIYKSQPLKQFQKNYKTHMYNLHEIYKNQLKPNDKKMTLDQVNEYFIQLEHPLQLWSVNYEKNNPVSI